MESFFLQSVLIALAVGISSGSIGAFIILRRMALAGDALSHVALPGIALALAYHFDPFWGVLAFLSSAAVLIWWLEGKTNLPTEAIVGLLFTTSLAIGILTIPNTEIVESLFGVFPAFPPYVLALVVSMAALLSLVTFLLAKYFLFAIVSPELASVNNKGRIIDLFFFLIFVFVVALGIKLVGTLLMGALTIIPASIAKNLSRSMVSYMITSTVLGGVIAFLGVTIAARFGFLPGPAIILSGVMIFLVSLIFRR